MPFPALDLRSPAMRRAIPRPALLLLFLLLPQDASPATKPQYLVVVPSQLYAGVPEKVCVTLSHLNETVILDIMLNFGPSLQNILANQAVQKDSFHCTPFVVPPSQVLIAILTVRIRGATQLFTKNKPMQILKVENPVFVQTDKPMYKPGQTVKFRIVSVDVNFRPLNPTFPLVYIENPKKNQIFQWRNLRLEGGIRQLSFPLSSEPVLGSYKVTVLKDSGGKIEHVFEVKEYVAPKFEIQVKVPERISILDEEFKLSVCGSYTYGKPVPGLVKINICRNYAPASSYCGNRHIPNICEEFSQEADKKGCFTRVIKTQMFQLRQRAYEMKLHVDATFEEEGTGLELSGYGSCEITATLSKLKFTKVDSYFRRGLPLFAQILLVDDKAQPIPNASVSVRVLTGDFESRHTTNKDGLVDLSLNTFNFTSSSIVLVATHQQNAATCYDGFLDGVHEPAEQLVRHVFSESKSSVHLELVARTLPCGRSHTTRAHYALNELVLKEERELTFYYLLKARGVIVSSGVHALSPTAGHWKGVFSFSFRVDPELAPEAQLLLYTILPNGEMVADTQKLEIEHCFTNQVHMGFSSTQSLPASDIHVKVTATPLSLCALRVVDQSMLLLKPEKELSPKSVYSLLPSKTPVKSPEDPGASRDCVYAEDIIHNGVVYTPKHALDDEDIHSVLESAGFDVFTNSKVRKPRFCHLLPFGGMSPVGFGPGMGVSMGMPVPMGYGVGPGVPGLPGVPGVPGLPGVIPGIPGVVPGVPGVAAGGMIGGGGGVGGVGFAASVPVALPAAVPGAVPGAIPGGVMAAGFGVPGGVTAAGLEGEGEQAAPRSVIRKFFPETWIWDLVTLDPSGGAELNLKIPDAITEWKAGALCLSTTTGLGLSREASLRVFQPLFLALTLPYSVVRGEAFTLKATAVNYLPRCLWVSVKLEILPEFLAVPVGEHEESHCLCANERKTLSWAVTPQALGEMNFTASLEVVHTQKLCGNEVAEKPALSLKDTVVRPLLVEPEGIEREETFNSLVCASSNRIPEKLSLKVPSNVVDGSARATYSVLGDILASAMKNLQNLLRMPRGCGEQNMILFVPNIYVLNYLNATQQLTDKLKAQALSHLASGYQTQLNFKHQDGSYSTFGERHATTPGNTWLTAFVLKSFVHAQPHIFMDNQDITRTYHWLLQKQKDNGCFEPSGSLLNNAIKGGVSDELTLSAYVTIALLEMRLPVTHPSVRNAFFCLETAWRTISLTQGDHVYTKALLAYAYALAGSQAMRNMILESLNREAVREDNSIHWERREKGQGARTSGMAAWAPSAEVEMTSYVLLAYLTNPSPSDLTMASYIVKWIIRQQNSHGGFSSTQDTVIALQALAKYGAITFTKNARAALVNIKSSRTFSQDFHVDDGNRLLLQEVSLPEVPGDYSVTVSGSGCVYLQATLKYNILPKKERKAPFNLGVEILPQNCDGMEHVQKKFKIVINISYTGDRPSSNMVIVDVKMVSGFVPEATSTKQLQNQADIQRTEVSSSHVVIYLEKLTSKIVSFSFFVEQEVEVKNLQPATVKAYDYYETDEFTIEEYNIPCRTESEPTNA